MLRTHTLPTRLLAALLSAALALGAPVHAAAEVRLPSLGDAAAEDLSVSAERRLGLEIMREARRDPAFLDDPVIQAYLESLWQPLVAVARQRGDISADTTDTFAWEIFGVLDRSVNAFALPGGFVGVHLGLIALTQTRDQLASVLAHELAHVTQRHIARSVSVSQQASIISIASLLLAILAAGRSGNADAVNATIAGGQAAAIQGQLNFSRDMEREADRIGYSLLQGGGFATTGMAEMFQRMDQATRLSDSNAFPYLRTHPLTVERMAEARSRTLVPGSAEGQAPLLHALMQARARVLMDPSVQGLQRLSGQTSSADLPDRLHALYAGALAAQRLGVHERGLALLDEAESLLAQARVREPAAEAVLRLQRAQALLALQQPAGALQALQRRVSPPLSPAAPQLAPSTLPASPPAAAQDDIALRAFTERPVLLLRAQATLEQQRLGQPGAAEALRDSVAQLQTWAVQHPQDAAVWQALATAAEAAGQPLRSLRAAAEARAALGDLGGAIDRLRAGQEAARQLATPDFIESSIIDARLRQVVAERRQLFLDSRNGRGGPGQGRDGPEDPRPQ